MKKILLILFVLLVIAGVIWGILTLVNRQQQESEAIAAQHRVFEDLPAWAQDVITMAGLLVGVDIVGNQLIMAVLAIFQFLVITVALVLSIPVLILLRNHPAVAEIIFKIFLVIGIAGAMMVGLVIATTPGGRTIFTVEIAGAIILAIIGMGGGIGVTNPTLSVDAQFGEHGGSAKIGAGGGGFMIVGRGRSASSTKDGGMDWK